MTAISRPRPPSVLLALACLLVLLGPASDRRPAAAGPAEQLVATAPLTAGQATLRDRAAWLRPIADRRDGHRLAPLAILTTAAAGAALLLAAWVRPEARRRGRHARHGAADARGPPLVQRS